MAKSLSAQADELLPLLQRRLGISEVAGAQSAAIAAAPHALYGPSHFGVLDRSQAPWVATDVAAAIAAHASNLNAHTQLNALSMTTEIKSSNFVGGFTGAGWRVDYGIGTASQATAELDNLIVRGRMTVYELLVHQIRATNGSIFVSSTGKVKTVTGSGPYTITTETDHGFATNDLIRAQRFTGTSVWQCNMTVTSAPSLTQFTATLSSGNAPAVGMEFVRLGNTTDTSRQGSIYMTADDTGAPFLSVQDGVNSFASWGTAAKVKAYVGKLNNLGFTGYGFYARGATTYQYFVVDDYGIGLSDADLRQSASGTTVLELLNSDGIGILEDAYGTWAAQRAIEWWPDLDNKTGNPSLQIRTGKIPSGPLAGQNWSQINAYPTGGKLARIDMIASGASGYVSSLVELIGGMSGSPNSEATVQASKLTANVDVLKITPYVGGSTVLSWQSTPSTAAWSTSGWTRLIELLNTGAIVWPHTGSGYSRMIGSTSNGTFYLGRSTANDASGAAIYDMIVDTAGSFSFFSHLYVGGGGLVRVRNGSGGYADMVPGDASHTGSVQWVKANGTRLGYMGYDNTNIYLGLENSANFLVGGGNIWVGNTSDLSGAKIQTDGNIHAVGAVVSEVFLQVYAASTPASGSTVSRVFLRSSDNALCAIMPSGTVRVLAIN